MDAFIGIDVGTSSVKAILVDVAGRVLAARESRHPLANPRPGWLEQNPELWWEATQTALGALSTVVAGNRFQVLGIGLSGQWLELASWRDEKLDIRKAKRTANR